MQESRAPTFGALLPAAMPLMLWLMIAVAVVGCGERVHELTPVRGKVTYKGEPLKFGCVTLQPDRGQWSRGVIQADGSFEMETPGEGVGAAVGMNRVRITCFEAQDPSSKLREGMAGISLGKSLIPQKYSHFETSDLTVEVQRGMDAPVVFDLQE